MKIYIANNQIHQIMKWYIEATYGNREIQDIKWERKQKRTGGGVSAEITLSDLPAENPFKPAQVTEAIKVPHISEESIQVEQPDPEVEEIVEEVDVPILGVIQESVEVTKEEVSSPNPVVTSLFN